MAAPAADQVTSAADARPRPTRDERARQLSRTTKAVLCRMYRTGIVTPQGTTALYLDGMYPPEQWRKDEVISVILRIEYPPDETADSAPADAPGQ
jgi:hypothetical protein